jgi:hypothetical protein
MEISQRELVTALHGMLFGGFFLMALFGAFVLLLELSNPELCASDAAARPAARWQRIYLITLVVLGWAAVISGAYLTYPWYRAVAPAGADLTLYPKLLLTAHANTSGWHSFGMEWKEHVAWIAPMAATMAVWVMLRHRAAWNASCQVRNAVLGFAAAAFLAAAIAGGCGAMINKKAPVTGGQTYQIMRSAK